MPVIIPQHMSYEINDYDIRQRISDGYFDASEMCDVCAKDLSDYMQLRFTKRFLIELSDETGISRSQLVQDKGDASDVWVHPRVAINLAQWVSPKLALSVPIWVFNWMRKQEAPNEEPKERFADYDPTFGLLIDTALNYSPKKRGKK